MRRLALVLALLVAPACGDDGDDDDTAETTTATTATSTTAPSTTTTADEGTTSTTEDLSGEGIGDLEAVLAELLVQPDELGDPPVEEQGYAPDQFGVCGDGDPDGEPAALVGTSVGGPERAIVQELRAYETLEAAAAASAAMRTGMACGEPVDELARIGGDEAYTRQLGDATFVVARVTDVVATFQVTGAIDPVEVGAFGVGKLLAFLEQG